MKSRIYMKVLLAFALPVLILTGIRNHKKRKHHVIPSSMNRS